MVVQVQDLDLEISVGHGGGVLGISDVHGEDRILLDRVWGRHQRLVVLVYGVVGKVAAHEGVLRGLYGERACRWDGILYDLQGDRVGRDITGGVGEEGEVAEVIEGDLEDPSVVDWDNLVDLTDLYVIPVDFSSVEHGNHVAPDRPVPAYVLVIDVIVHDARYWGRQVDLVRVGYVELDLQYQVRYDRVELEGAVGIIVASLEGDELVETRLVNDRPTHVGQRDGEVAGLVGDRPADGDPRSGHILVDLDRNPLNAVTGAVHDPPIDPLTVDLWIPVEGAWIIPDGVPTNDAHGLIRDGNVEELGLLIALLERLEGVVAVVAEGVCERGIGDVHKVVYGYRGVGIDPRVHDDIVVGHVVAAQDLVNVPGVGHSGPKEGWALNRKLSGLDRDLEGIAVIDGQVRGPSDEVEGPERCEGVAELPPEEGVVVARINGVDQRHTLVVDLYVHARVRRGGVRGSSQEHGPVVELVEQDQVTLGVEVLLTWIGPDLQLGRDDRYLEVVGIQVSDAVCLEVVGTLLRERVGEEPAASSVGGREGVDQGEALVIHLHPEVGIGTWAALRVLYHDPPGLLDINNGDVVEA